MTAKSNQKRLIEIGLAIGEMTSAYSSRLTHHTFSRNKHRVRAARFLRDTPARWRASLKTVAVSSAGQLWQSGGVAGHFIDSASCERHPSTGEVMTASVASMKRRRNDLV